MNEFFPEAYTAYDAPFAENNLTTTEHPPRLRPLSAPPPQYRPFNCLSPKKCVVILRLPRILLKLLNRPKRDI